MIELTLNEARALGVLIEKAATTPEQYPLSLNALTAGCNQKSNRDPVLNLSEDDVFTAVESLREKQLAVKVDAMGSRVHKYRHEAERVLGVGGGSLAILAELMLRGPQTLGELRGRASRMAPIETLDEAETRVRALVERDEPLVRAIPAAPGSRAGRYRQLLTAGADPVAENIAPPQAAATSAAQIQTPSGGGLAEHVAKLQQDVASLRAAVSKLATEMGSPDPFANDGGTEDAS